MSLRDILTRVAPVSAGYRGEQIDAVAGRLGVEFPPALRALYADCGGQPWTREQGMRLLSLDEVEAAVAVWRRRFADFGEVLTQVVPFLANDDDWFLVVHVAPPLRGFVGLVTLDEFVVWPAFRTIERAIQSCVELTLRARADDSVCFVEELSRAPEFPLQDADPTLFRALLAEAEPLSLGRLRRQTLLSSLRLIPVGEVATLQPFLADPDLCVREGACEVAGLWRESSLVPELQRLAEEASDDRFVNNVRIAVITALKAMPGEEARDALVQLRRRLPASFAGYFGERR